MAIEERRVLAEASRTGIELGNHDLEHLANSAGIRNYQRMADDVARRVRQGRVLDWGCGYGQMTYLLRNRSVDVQPFDVGPRENIAAIPLFSGLGIQYGSHPWQLPFDAGSFDAVLSCGVLEHVPDPYRSCREIARILRPDGKFVITMLPNRYSFIERVNNVLRISDHPVKYTFRSAARLLRETGFDTVEWRHANMLPKNLIGLPDQFKALYGQAGALVVGLDSVLSRVAFLNWVSGTIEIVARRRGSE